MKKSKRLELSNREAEQWHLLIQEAISGQNACRQKRLRHCSAIVREYVVDLDTPGDLIGDHCHIYVLQSYNTDVAYVVDNFNLGVDVLRLVYGYTSTSCQHIRKFFDDYIDKTIISSFFVYH